MPGTHYISSSVNISKENLTITGQYQEWEGKGVIIDAQGKCRHFISSSDSNGKSGFVFEKLALVNGYSAGKSSGGSMFFKTRTGIIRNCVF